MTASDPTSTPRPPDVPASETSHAHAKALLAELGPARTLGMLAALTKELGADAALPADAVPWDASASAMAHLAHALHTGKPVAPASPAPHAAEVADDGEGTDDDTATEGDAEELEAGDDTESAEDDVTGEDHDAEEEATTDNADDAAAPPAPRAPSRRRRVAGIVEPGPRVLSCRVRTLHESGTRGELVGRTNAQGIEETEWPLATMTPEFFRHLTRRGGQFMFEWFGRDDSGKRVGLGRSSSIRVRGDAKPRAERPRPVTVAVAPPATPPSMGFGFEQFLALQRYQDERSDRDRDRRERAQAQAMETQRHQAALASAERIRRMELEVDMAKTQTKARASAPATGGAPLTEEALQDAIDRKVDDALAEAMPKKDIAVPPWLEHLGLTPSVLEMIKPQLQTIVPTLMAKIQQMGPKAPPGATPSSMPVSPYIPRRFVPAGGAG